MRSCRARRGRRADRPRAGGVARGRGGAAGWGVALNAGGSALLRGAVFVVELAELRHEVLGGELAPQRLLPALEQIVVRLGGADRPRQARLRLAQRGVGGVDVLGRARELL